MKRGTELHLRDIGFIKVCKTLCKITYTCYSHNFLVNKHGHSKSSSRFKTVKDIGEKSPMGNFPQIMEEKDDFLGKFNENYPKILFNSS